MNTEKNQIMTFRGTKLIVKVFGICDLHRRNVLYINIENISKILGTIIQTFRTALVSKNPGVWIYKLLARPSLSYCCKSWKMLRTCERRMIPAETLLKRRLLGNSFSDSKRSAEIMRQIQFHK
jgi:hypothetical protein